jgi:hypothetical protein
VESLNESGDAVLDVLLLGMHPITSIYYKLTESNGVGGIGDSGCKEGDEIGWIRCSC